jgi:molybdopterin converting factor small subunit
VQFSIGSITNEGTSPTYKWLVNNVQRETASSFNYTVVDGDEVKLELTSSESCVTSSVVYSNVTAISASPRLIPSVGIAVDGNDVCQGTTQELSIVSSENLGNASYQWRINGVDAGVSARLSRSFDNNDKVTLEATSSLGCLSTTSAVSNEIKMVVKALATPEVIIEVDQNNVCPGTSQSFTIASSSNLGNNATYQWKINGSNAGALSSLSQAFSDGDRVQLVATSSESCVASSTATSNEIVVQTSNSGVPTVSIE